jgi:hypothetical protein
MVVIFLLRNSTHKFCKPATTKVIMEPMDIRISNGVEEDMLPANETTENPIIGMTLSLVSATIWDQ